MTKGGDGTLGHIMSEESKNRISEYRKKYYIDHPEVKEDLRKFIKKQRENDTLNNICKKCVLLDLKGNYIDRFNNCNDAAKYINKQIGTNFKTVYYCCTHERNRVGNYISLFEDEWLNIYKDNKEKLDELVFKTTKEYISIKKSHKVSEEQKQKHSLLMKQKFIDNPELKENMSKERKESGKYKGEKNGNAKKVILIDIINNKEEEFGCIKYVADKFNLKPITISSYIKSKKIFKDKYLIKIKGD